METLFVSKEATLNRRENTLSITVDGRRRPFPIEKISHIVLLSQSKLNSSLLCLCGANGVRISVFDYYGYCKGTFEPPQMNPAGRVKLEQARHILNDVQKMPLAREIIRGAAHNMRANLQYYAYRDKAALKENINQMNRLIPKIDHAVNSAELMGIEGNLHVIYFNAWKRIDERLDFAKRIRRPPNNPINCLISFINQLVYTVVKHEISKTHLDDTLSWLHAPGSGRSSLSLDLSEPFKPVLTDALIFKLVRKAIMNDSWFTQQPGVCLLSETGRRHVAEHFSIKLEERLQGNAYREWIYKEALNIERHVMGMQEYDAFKRKV